jgi:hypothetical protein
MVSIKLMMKTIHPSADHPAQSRYGLARHYLGGESRSRRSLAQIKSLAATIMTARVAQELQWRIWRAETPNISACAYL